MQHRRNRMTALLIIGLAGTWLGAVEPAVIVHDDLRRESVQVLGLSDGRLRYFASDRSLDSADVSRIVRLEFPRRPQGVTAGRLRLSDGQALRGHLAPIAAQDQVLAWETPSLGTVTIPLDHIASFATSQEVAPPQPGDGVDVVLLRNGDRLVGFIEAVDAEGIALDREGATVQVPWSSLSAVTLANPLRSRPGDWITLVDGSTLRVQELTLGAEKAAGRALEAPLEVSTDQVLRIDFATHQRLVSLGDLPWQVDSGGQAFGVDYPPRFREGLGQLHAPVVLRITLPPGAQRFAAEARLEPESVDLADMILSIRSGDQQVLRQRLNADRTRVAINVPLTGSTLVLELDDGPGGPVRDRLLLEQPVVLVRDTPGP